MKVISIILLIVFTATSVAVVPVHAGDEELVTVAGDRDPREKPPPPDSGKRPPREKPDPPSNDRGTRPPRERGDPPEHNNDYRDDDYVAPLEWPAQEPVPGHCHCGRIYCQVHGYSDGAYYSRDNPLVGLYGLTATTVMILNLLYAADEDQTHDGLGAAGVGLGVIGVVWAFNADDPWSQRTLFLAGLLTAGFGLAQWAADSPSSDVPDYRRSTPAASVSFSF